MATEATTRSSLDPSSKFTEETQVIGQTALSLRKVWSLLTLNQPVKFDLSDFQTNGNVFLSFFLMCIRFSKGTQGDWTGDIF